MIFHNFMTLIFDNICHKVINCKINLILWLGCAVPWMLPYLHDISVDISLASCYHLICDFDKERCHSFRCVVALRDTVNHSDGIH